MDEGGQTVTWHARWRRLRAWPLWTKVSILLLLVSGVPLVLLGATIVKHERAAVRAAAIDLLDARVDDVRHTLEAMFRGYRASAVRAARYPTVIDFCAGSTRDREGGMGLLQAHLADLREVDSGIAGVGVIDLEGTVVAATTSELVGADLSFRSYFQRARGGVEAISDLYVGVPASGRLPAIAFAVPIWSRDGEVVGVLVLWLRAEALWQVMHAGAEAAGRGSSFALFDRHGIRIGDTSGESSLFHPAAPVPEDVARAMIAERRFQERTEELLGSVVPFPVHELEGPGRRRIFERSVSAARGDHALAVSRYFPALDATLVGLLPEAELEVGAPSLLPRVLPAFGVALALVLMGGVLLLRQVVWPIGEVAAAAAALEQGNLRLEQRSALPDGAPGDEIAALSRSFHSMARTLSDRDRALRERNAQLERRERALRTLSECNEALVRATDERTLLHAVCDIVVRVGGYRLCWVGYAEQDERRSVVPVAHAGNDGGYLSTAQVDWTDGERGRGPVGTAVRTARPVITRSVASDPAFAPWVREALRRGFRSVAAIPVVADGGAVVGALAIYADAEDAFDESELRLLTELADDLAYGITALRGRAERLAMTARLLDADRMVAVGTLAAGVAHEINNPLAYVMGALQFLDEELRTLAPELPPGRLEPLEQALADARDGARRVAGIVRDVKTFSRAGEERRAPVDLHAALQSAIKLAHGELKHRARLVEDLGSVPFVLANEARLCQVFLNLLINAAQAIPAGRPDEHEIRVSTFTRAPGRAVAEIRDTGSGIPPEIARHVFDPFFTTKPAGVGTGLGLFICRNIVTAAGGEIAFESRPGEGTVFRVELPAAA